MSNLFLQGMLWCDMVKTWWDISCCMRWSCFVTESSATGRGHMVVTLLYAMQSPCNCFTLSLSGSDSHRSNSWWDDNDTSMEIKVSSRWRWWSWQCFGDGDHRHKMMMTMSYHLYWLHVTFILYASYFSLYGGRNVRWSLNNFQGTSVLLEYAPLLQFVVPRHHVMIGYGTLRSHTMGASQFCTRRILGLNLTSLAYADMASEHWDRKVEHESYSRYDQHSDVHHWKLLHFTWWSVMV